MPRPRRLSSTQSLLIISCMPIDPGPSLWSIPDPLVVPAGQDAVFSEGDLEPSTIIPAYSAGLFPLPVMDESVGHVVLGWWSPDPRGIIELDALRVSRSLRQSIKRFTVSIDTCFETVMRACGDPRRPDGWINEEFVQAYVRLYEMGWAHSVEVRNRAGQLVGGLYGVEVGGLFAGESMFHYERDASKVALVALVEILRSAPNSSQRILDTQWTTDHLKSLGAIDISREEYCARLPAALKLAPAFPYSAGK